MSHKTVVITFDVEWMDRKIDQERRDLCMLVMQAGGKNVRFEVKTDGAEEPQPDRWLKILCKPCDGIYYSRDTVIPCPKCGSRDIERLGRVSAPPPQPVVEQQTDKISAENGQDSVIPAREEGSDGQAEAPTDMYRTTTAVPEGAPSPGTIGFQAPEETDEGPVTIRPEVLGQ